MRFSALLCLGLCLAACSGSNVPADVSQAPAGLYDTDYGPLALSAPTAAGAVEGAYADANTLSRVTGIYRDGTLTGRWATQFMDGTCEPDEDGLTAYGRLTLEFADDLSGFDGRWGWCDDGEQAESWNGSYEGPRPNGATLVGLVAPVGGVLPSEDAQPPAGVYLTGRGELIIMPPDANGGFVGRLEEVGTPALGLGGTVEGTVLRGVWVDRETEGRCSPLASGATHYGRFELELNSAGLTGSQGVCNDGPLTQRLAGLRN